MEHLLIPLTAHTNVHFLFFFFTFRLDSLFFSRKSSKHFNCVEWKLPKVSFWVCGFSFDLAQMDATDMGKISCRGPIICFVEYELCSVNTNNPQKKFTYHSEENKMHPKKKLKKKRDSPRLRSPGDRSDRESLRKGVNWERIHRGYGGALSDMWSN